MSKTRCPRRGRADADDGDLRIGCKDDVAVFPLLVALQNTEESSGVQHVAESERYCPRLTFLRQLSPFLT